MKKHHQLLSLVVMLTLLVAGDVFSAWTAPGQLPPNGNVDAPVNVGDTDQIKAGGLGVGGLDVAGGTIVRGTASTTDLDLTVTGRIGATQYCDINGNNCVASPGGSSTGDGIGYDQRWTVVNRTNGVWYRNSTDKPIMVFHKNIWDGTVVDVGVSTSTFVTMNYQDYDSDLDNGSTIIIPVGHYYRFGTWTENSGNGHRVVRELR